MKYIALSNRTGITGDVVTIATDPTNPQSITPLDLVVEVSQPATLTIELGGTVPTGGSNPITPTPLYPGASAPKAKVWNSSNSTGGAVVSIAMSIPAGVPYPIELRHLWLGGNGVDKMLTFRFAHASGNSKFSLFFEE